MSDEPNVKWNKHIAGPLARGAMQAQRESNVTRVMLGEDVTELVLYAATQNEAYNILNAAVDKQEANAGEMTLHEALQFIKRDADKVEDLYRACGVPFE